VNHRSDFRSQIRPFPQEPVYPTGWAGTLPFERIAEEVRPRAAKMLLKQYRVWAQDLDDCLQNGLSYLWGQLVVNRAFLAHSSRLDAAILVCHRSKSTTMRKYNRRYDYIEDLWADSGLQHADERGISGYEHFQFAGEPWAAWATLTDLRVDLERAILAVYEQVKGDHAGLLALYAATTDVTCKDLAYIVPGKGEEVIRRRAVTIREELRTHLRDLDSQPTRWQDKFQAGDVTPAQQLLTQYQHNAMMAQAIHSLLEGKSLRKAAAEVGYNVNSFQNYRKRAGLQLARAYHCTA
jgi:hypothetical protein